MYAADFEADQSPVAPRTSGVQEIAASAICSGAASEVLPLVKTGGLVDVSAALPSALNDLYVDTRLLLPAFLKAGSTR